MANIKISELTELEQVDNDDLLVIVDTSANETKKVKARNVGTGGGGSDVVIISDTEPTNPDTKLWIDTGEVGESFSEITNEYSTSTGKGYSANYINNALSWKELATNVGCGSSNEVELPTSYNELFVEVRVRNSQEQELYGSIPFYIPRYSLVISKQFRLGYYISGMYGGAIVKIGVSDNKPTIYVDEAYYGNTNNTQYSIVDIYYR